MTPLQAPLLCTNSFQVGEYDGYARCPAEEQQPLIGVGTAGVGRFRLAGARRRHAGSARAATATSIAIRSRRGHGRLRCHRRRRRRRRRRPRLVVVVFGSRRREDERGRQPHGVQRHVGVAVVAESVGRLVERQRHQLSPVLEVEASAERVAARRGGRRRERRQDGMRAKGLGRAAACRQARCAPAAGDGHDALPCISRAVLNVFGRISAGGGLWGKGQRQP